MKLAQHLLVAVALVSVAALLAVPAHAQTGQAERGADAPVEREPSAPTAPAEPYRYVPHQPYGSDPAEPEWTDVEIAGAWAGMALMAGIILGVRRSVRRMERGLRWL